MRFSVLIRPRGWTNRIIPLSYVATGIAVMVSPKLVYDAVPPTVQSYLSTSLVAAIGAMTATGGLLAFLSGVRVVFPPSYKDEQERSFENSVQAAERRMEELIENRLKSAARESLDINPTLIRLLNEKLDVGLIEAVDDSLKRRITSEARSNRTLDFMNQVTLELKNRLEGPSARAETAASRARLGAYCMAIIGLLVAGYRVFTLGDLSNRLMNLLTIAGDKPLWPIIAAQAAPYVGFVLLAEFTAFLFLRFSNQSIALQRYFTEGLAQLRDRHLAMRFVVEFGSPEQVVEAAQRMIDASNRELKFLDETKKDDSALSKAATSLKEKATLTRRGKAAATKTAQHEVDS